MAYSKSASDYYERVPGFSKAVPITLTKSEKAKLTKMARKYKSGDALAVRAKMILLAAQGWHNGRIAMAVGTSRVTVTTWRTRFAYERFEGLDDKRLPHNTNTTRPKSASVTLTSAQIKSGTKDLVLEGKILLELADRRTFRWIAKKLDCKPLQVGNVKRAMKSGGINAVKALKLGAIDADPDRKGRGRRTQAEIDALDEKIANHYLTKKPPKGKSEWTFSALARKLNVSPTRVSTALRRVAGV